MQAKKLSGKMLQYILAKCGCEMLMGNEAVALKDHILALEVEAVALAEVVNYYQNDHVDNAKGSAGCTCHICSKARFALAAFREANPTTTEK